MTEVTQSVDVDVDVEGGGRVRGIVEKPPAGTMGISRFKKRFEICRQLTGGCSTIFAAAIF